MLCFFSLFLIVCVILGFKVDYELGKRVVVLGLNFLGMRKVFKRWGIVVLVFFCIVGIESI